MPPATNDNEDDENIIYLRSRRDRREPEGRDNEGDDTTQRRRLRNDADEEEDNDEDNNNPRRQRVRVDEASYDQGVFADNYVDNENNGEGGNPQPAVVVVPPPPAIVPPPMPTHTTNTIGIAAALRHAYPSGYSRDAMKEELAMQANIKGDNQAIASFRTEILQQQGLTVFAFLQQKDMTIHLLHSPATYYARGASGPLRGKDIGFVGDRSPFSTPAPIILQPEKPWKWITKQIVTEPTTFEYFYANPANTGKFFTATAGATLTRVTAPRLLLLPGNLVQYCAEAQRTPWDLHQHVTAMVSAPGAGHDFQHYQLVLDWCCMALTSEGGDSALQYVHNAMTDIPSRSFGSEKKWTCETDEDLRSLFNTLFPLPSQASWNVFQPSAAICTKVISVLRTTVSTTDEWRRLPKRGTMLGTTGLPMSNLWDWTLCYRTQSTHSKSEHSQDSQDDYEQDTTAATAKSQLLQSIALSRPLARRSPWPLESTPQK